MDGKKENASMDLERKEIRSFEEWDKNTNKECLEKESDIYPKISQIAMRFAIIFFVLEIVFSYCYSLLFDADEFEIHNIVTNIMMFVVVVSAGTAFASSIIGYKKNKTRLSKETLIISIALILGIGGGLLLLAGAIYSVLISFR